MGVITLTDSEETRALSVVCDAPMKYQLSLRSTDERTRGKLLPEVLMSMLTAATGAGHLELNVYALVEGEYKVTLLDTENLYMSKIRLSDAVLLTRIGDIPLYMDSELFARQCGPYNSKTNRLAIPINTLPMDKLKEELQRAIDTEDYRLASVIKDEIGKRQGQQNKEE